MKTLLISSGHATHGDRGASGNGYVEGDLTIELRDLICKELDILGVKYTKDRNQDALSATLQYFKNLFTKNTVSLDIHFNGGIPAANGTEVIIPDIYSKFEKQLANDLLTDLIYMGWKNRGVKTEKDTARKKLGWMRNSSETVLIEVCFISNVKDMEIYQAKKYSLAKEIAKTLASAVKD